MKGFKMALPFVAGLVAGVGAIALYNNRTKVKEMVGEAYEKSLDLTSNAKDKIVSTASKFKKEAKEKAKDLGENKEDLKKEIETLKKEISTLKKTKTTRAKKQTTNKDTNNA